MTQSYGHKYDTALDELNKKLIDYNSIHDSDFKITHNGLELWIFTNYSGEDFDNLIVLAKNNGFKNAQQYGLKHQGFVLGNPDVLEDGEWK